MKLRFTAFLLVLNLPLLLFSQSENSAAKYSNRYRLDIPKEWNKPKLMLAITDVLPRTLDELKEKDFCTEGKALYSVQLVMGIPDVTNENNSEAFRTSATIHYTLSFNYQFSASLYVIDTLGNPVTSLLLVSKDEMFDYRQQFVQQLLTEPIRANTGGLFVTRRVESTFQNPGYKPASARRVLTEQFLLGICENKLYEIRKLLGKLSSN